MLGSTPVSTVYCAHLSKQSVSFIMNRFLNAFLPVFLVVTASVHQCAE